MSDRIPDDDARQFLSEKYPKLWWVRSTPSTKGHVHEQDRRNGTLARPMANIQNWISHLEDFENAKMLLALGAPRQSYFVQLAVWLADLMILRVVEYEKYYLNRLTGKMEDVPWL